MHGALLFGQLGMAFLFIGHLIAEIVELLLQHRLRSSVRLNVKLELASHFIVAIGQGSRLLLGSLRFSCLCICMFLSHNTCFLPNVDA